MKTILVPIDFSDVAGDIIETVKKIATAFASRVILLHVRQTDPLIGNIAEEQISMTPSAYLPTPPVMVHVEPTAQAQQRLDWFCQRFAGLPVEVTSRQCAGNPEEMILKVCEEEDADMIVIGSHGHGALYNLLVGSVTEGVLKDAKCPLLVIPSPRAR